MGDKNCQRSNFVTRQDWKGVDKNNIVTHFVTHFVTLETAINKGIAA